MMRILALCLFLFCLARVDAAGGGGLDVAKLRGIDAVVQSGIDEHRVPGGVVWVEHGGQVYSRALGNRALVPAVEAMTSDTVFDVASLTKVLATAPAVMLLVERGKVGLDTAVSNYIPEFAGEKGKITVRELLTHTSGLPPGISTSSNWQGAESAIRLAAGAKLESAPGTKFRYSDINFFTLGEIVARVSGQTLDVFCSNEIYGPLKMADTGFLPAQSKIGRVAPTEVVGGVLLRGTVHDPTARRMGGVAGHAGLFTTAADMARFARMMLNMGELDGTRIFKPETVRLMTSVQTPAGMEDRRGLGWDIDSGYSSPRGELFPRGSYGMTGFTGAAFWIDPFSKTFFIFLSSRLHPDGKGSVSGLYRTIGTLAAGAVTDFDFGTVAGAAPALPKIALRPVFPKLECENPVWMEQVPDGSDHVAIVCQDGVVLMARKGGDGSGAQEWVNIKDRKPHVSLEEGLLGLAFHPGFKTNGLFYLFYSRQEPRRSVISEWKVPAATPDRADPGSERILLEIPQPSEVHKGGQLSFGADGFLYASVGDGGGQNDEFGAGQNTSNLRGKILRIDVNSRSEIGLHGARVALPYGLPSDNPFMGEPDFWENSVRKEIWAYGLRNPWRFSWDRQTGEMWTGDVGQDKWEEIDLIVKGGNYGWGAREGAHHFKPGPEGARYIDPVLEYPHNTNLLAESAFPRHGIGACVIGGYVYRGAKHPALRGIYIYGDYVLGTVWGFRYAGGKVVEYGTLLEQPKNISSFAEDLDGELYVLTLDGRVFEIVPAGEASN